MVKVALLEGRSVPDKMKKNRPWDCFHMTLQKRGIQLHIYLVSLLLQRIPWKRQFGVLLKAETLLRAERDCGGMVQRERLDAPSSGWLCSTAFTTGLYFVYRTTKSTLFCWLYSKSSRKVSFEIYTMKKARTLLLRPPDLVAWTARFGRIRKVLVI